MLPRQAHGGEFANLIVFSLVQSLYFFRTLFVHFVAMLSVVAVLCARYPPTNSCQDTGRFPGGKAAGT